MFENTKAFSGFSVDDILAARKFYGDTLGIRVSEQNGILTLHIAGDRDIIVYPKENHVPATFASPPPRISMRSLRSSERCGYRVDCG